MNAPTPAQLLEQNLVLTLGQVAVVLGLTTTRGRHKGEPSKRLALELVEAGKLRPVDPSQPVGRMTVSCAEVRRYLSAPSPLALVQAGAA
jgi:hypothetical protein